MILQGAAFLLATLYWVVTAFYGVLTSQAFVQEQFLAPRLFPPLALFADWHAAIGVVTLMPWVAVRLLREREGRTFAAIGICAGGVALIALAAPLSGSQTATTSWTVIVVGLVATIALAAAEWAPIRPGVSAVSEATGMALASGHGLPRDRSLADLAACVIAACGAAVAQSAATLLANGSTSGLGPAGLTEAGRSLRLHLLLAGAVFLSLVVVRALAELCGRRRAAVERSITGVLMATAFAGFLHFVVLSSLSIRGFAAAAIATGMGVAIALAVIARGGSDDAVSDDGVDAALTSLTPRVVRHGWGFAAWLVVLGALAAAVGLASRTTDWNFVLARTGVMVIWLLTLAGAIAVTRRIAMAGAQLAFAIAGAILLAHVSIPAARPSPNVAALDPAARWLGDILERPTQPAAGAEIVGLLHARTNIPRGSLVEPVDVNLAPLAGDPAVQRPHIFVFVVDSLRRDYLSPYNAKVSFTPSIAALADDSVVFRNAFTQYGATGLSIPSLWVGGPILHKQYVTPFAPMNSLAKLLAHERYTQWIGMDNIMDVILPASDQRERLDPNVAVKDFRMCQTLAGIRARLADSPPEAPLFVYSLPQDVHVSVVTREGARSIDERSYEGFYAPVASRVARLDACLGEFVSDLKARGLYEQSIIVITSDHGDSLGEEGRMGHAYSLHPEIVRVPLIVRVPPALRSQWAWDQQRAAFTTDITPTLYRLLGHDTHAPAEFFGESLAHPIGSSLPAPRDRMVAASYGAVYGALLDGGRRYYVFDAIAMRELAFSIDGGASPGAPIPITRELQQRGLAVIRRTVDDISRFYRYPPVSGGSQIASRR